MSAASMDFSGRRVLVTGGGRGIGKAIALKFLELRATVVVLDKDEQLLLDLEKEYPSITTVPVDLSDWNATRSAVQSVLPIHHLANNAAIAPANSLLEMDAQHIDSVYELNFKATINVAQVVAQGMIEHEIKDGTVVNTSSVGDSVAFPGIGIYSALKASIVMLTKTMAIEFAPHGIRVNCVRPGFTNTEMVKSMSQEFKDTNYGPALQRMVFHEMIEPEDIANAFVFLSSSLSRNVVGVTLTVDQGYIMQ